MNYTQEQIDAALAYIDYKETNEDLQLLHNITREPKSYTLVAAEIIAAAYRELLEAIHSTIAENLHLADGDDCTLKRLKDVIKFKLPEDQ